MRIESCEVVPSCRYPKLKKLFLANVESRGRRSVQQNKSVSGVTHRLRPQVMHAISAEAVQYIPGSGTSGVYVRVEINNLFNSLTNLYIFPLHIQPFFTFSILFSHQVLCNLSKWLPAKNNNAILLQQ